ncbi:MAG TPA: NADH-quinone oxidoreductase subunit NuoK [Chloroflexi bacterium]|mgnify:CR=1 FL=1|nr:NADH-quinone oxidoreductase subunit NuoK [Chloroflexota bacterium]
MNLMDWPWLDVVNTVLSLLLFGIGLGGLLTQRNILKQVFGIKIMLQGVTLGLIQAGRLHNDIHFAQSMVISALVVEAVIIAVALALIINAFRHYPSGDIDELRRLWG